jgi:hypothetical protein
MSHEKYAGLKDASNDEPAVPLLLHYVKTAGTQDGEGAA